MSRRLHTTLLAGLVALALAGCHSPEPQDAPPPPAQVSVLTLQPRDVLVVEDLPGRVAAFRTAEIRPQISGIVQRRQFEQGTEVAAGSVLFQINPAPFQAEVDTAAAALQRAQSVWKRAKAHAERLAPLVQADAVSQQVYDDAVSLRDQAAADVAQARAALARRKLDLTFATVDAPISGRIDQALVTEGALVAPNDSSPMATIQQIAQVYVDVRQSAGSLESLRDALDGSPEPASHGVSAQILGGTGRPLGLSGQVLFSGINVDASTGDVLLRVLVENPRRQLLPGMYVQARIPRAAYPQALTVPQQAVTHAGNATRVWVVDDQQRAHAVVVELGELVDRHYRVVKGLEIGQRVAVEGLERLSDGATVEPRAWPGASPALPSPPSAP